MQQNFLTSRQTTIALCIALALAFVGFGYLAVQPQRIANEFDRLLQLDNSESARALIVNADDPNLFQLDTSETLTLVDFESEARTATDWLTGQCRGRLLAVIEGGESGHSYIEDWECRVEVGHAGVEIVNASMTSRAVAIVPPKPYK